MFINKQCSSVNPPTDLDSDVTLTELENMLPWERDMYIGLLREHIENENNKLANKRNEALSQNALRKRYR